jgi:hypothetical protein
MSRTEKLNEVLTKYRFTGAVPPDVRKAMEKSKRKTLTGILRGKGGFGLVVFLSVSLYALLKKTGISVTITKCTVAVWCSLVIIAAAAVSGGTYLAVRHIMAVTPPGLHNTAVPVESETNVQQPAPAQPTAGQGRFEYDIGIAGFESDTDTGITSELSEALQRILAARDPGMRIGIVSRGTTGPGARLMLAGSLIRLEHSYRVTARLIDVKSSKIITMTSVTMENREGVESTGKKIADTIAKAIY